MISFNYRIATTRMMAKRSATITASCMALLSIMLAMPTQDAAGNEWSVGRTWPKNERVSYDQISHQPWNTLLSKYVDANGNVDYSGWKASRDDLSALDNYLESLGRVDFTRPATSTAQLAFWINAYNAVTVRGILREYPTTSIRNHTAKLFGYNIWKQLKLHVADNSYSLEAIEHEILRKMKEPRIHFAIVCASIGCPKLRNEAYTAKTLDQQLSSNARDFFSQPRHFRMGRDGTVYLSSILDWFGEDFGTTTADQLTAITPYLPAAAAKQITGKRTPKIVYLDYDWNLNDQKTAR